MNLKSIYQLSLSLSNSFFLNHQFLDLFIRYLEENTKTSIIKVKIFVKNNQLDINVSFLSFKSLKIIPMLLCKFLMENLLKGL